jgi:hypothetical protein
MYLDRPPPWGADPFLLHVNGENAIFNVYFGALAHI